MKKCVVIYNPHSGKNMHDNFIPDFIKVLNGYGYDVDFIYTEYKYHAFKIIDDINDNTDLVISLGGDGTFNEIVTGNLKRKKPLLLAHIPLGTTNDIGAMFGYSKNIISNLKSLLEGSVKNMDICTVNDRPFVYVAGFGKFLDVSYLTTSSQKRKWGYLAYLYNGIKSFFDKTNDYELTYTIDGETYQGKYSFFMISNANRIAGFNNFYKNIKLDDDRFEVLLCNITRKQDIIKSLYYLTKSDITKVPGFYFHKVNKMKIRFNDSQKINWCIDGERLDDDSREFEIKVLRNVRLLIPKKNIKNLFIDE